MHAHAKHDMWISYHGARAQLLLICFLPRLVKQCPNCGAGLNARKLDCSLWPSFLLPVILGLPRPVIDPGSCIVIILYDAVYVMQKRCYLLYSEVEVDSSMIVAMANYRCLW